MSFPWVTKGVDITTLLVLHWRAHYIFPLVHLFKSSFFRQFALKSVISLSKENQTILFAFTIFALGAASTTFNLFAFAFVTFLFLEAVFVEVVLS